MFEPVLIGGETGIDVVIIGFDIIVGSQVDGVQPGILFHAVELGIKGVEAMTKQAVADFVEETEATKVGVEPLGVIQYDAFKREPDVNIVGLELELLK